MKKEVSELKAEISLLKGGDAKESLTSEDIERCNKMVEEFIDSSDPSKTLVLADRLLINQCFYHFKHLFKDLNKKKGGSGAVGAGSGPNFGNVTSPEKAKADSVEIMNMQEEVQRLNLLV